MKWFKKLFKLKKQNDEQIINEVIAKPPKKIATQQKHQTNDIDEKFQKLMSELKGDR